MKLLSTKSFARINKLYLAIAIVTVAILAAVYTLVIPKLINLNPYKSEVVKIAQEAYPKYHFEIGDLELKLPLTGGIEVVADKIELKRNTTGEVFFALKDASINVSILNLLRKKLLINSAGGKDLYLKVIRKSNGDLDLEELFTEKQDEEPLIEFRNTTAMIEGYKIDFTDKALEKEKQFIIEGENFNLKGFTENKYIKFALDGTLNKTINLKLAANAKLPFTKELYENQFEAKGNVENFKIAMFKEYLEGFSPKGVVNAEFKSRLKNEKLTVSAEGAIVENIIIPKFGINFAPGTLKTRTTITPDVIDVDKLLVNTGDTKTKIKGTIAKYDTDNPQLKINLDTERINLTTLYNIAIKLDKTIFNELKNYTIKGNATTNLYITGALKKPRLYGKLSVNNTNLFFPDKTSIKGINAQLSFDGNRAVFKEANLPISKSGNISLKGVVDFVNEKFVNLIVKSTTLNNKNVKTLVVKLPFLERNLLNTIKNSSINGQSSFKLVLSGKFDQPKLEGSLTTNVPRANLAGFKRPIQNIKAKILLNKDKATIERFVFSLGSNNTFSVTGNYNIEKETTSGIKIFSNAINLANIKPYLVDAIKSAGISGVNWEAMSLDGSFNVNLKLVGKLDALKPYGKIQLNNIAVSSPDLPIDIDNISGPLAFNGQLNTTNVSVKTLNNELTFMAKGPLDGRKEFRIVSKGFNLEAFKKALLETNLLTPEEKNLLAEATINTTANIDLSAFLTNETITTKGIISLNQGTLSSEELPETVTVKGGDIIINNQQLSINNIAATIAGTDITIQGNVPDYINNPLVNNLELLTSNISLELLKKLGQKYIVSEDLQEIITSIDALKGDVRLRAMVENSVPRAFLEFENFEIVYKELEKPIGDIDGTLMLSLQGFNADEFVVNYGSSMVRLHGDASDLTLNPYLNFVINGQINPVDFTSLLPQDVEEKLTFTLPLYFQGFAKGTIQNWDLNLEAFVPDDAIIAYKGIFEKPAGVELKVTVDGKGTPEETVIDNLEILFANSAINLTGKVLTNLQKGIILEDLRLNIPQIDLTRIGSFFEEGVIAHDLSGNIQSKLIISGPILDPSVIGNISLKDVALPMLKTTDINSEISVFGSQASIDKLNLNLNGIILEMSSFVNDFTTLPMIFSSVKIHSPSLRLADLIAAMAIQTPDGPTLPILIRNGFITIEEAIIDNLITTNLRGNFVLCSSGLLQLNDLSFRTAGGEVNGNLYMNIFSEILGGQLKIIDVKANAAATILLNLPNEIFGDLSAQIVFKTQGSEYEDFLNNAVAEATLMIDDGRFSQLGTLEHLLTATNIIGGGITGLNLNNILASIIPINTGNFELLTGEFTVEDGILTSKSLTSRGKNLSLEVKGTYDLNTEIADLDVKGYLSKNVSGLLGPLGKLNINTFVDFIPGLGFIPGSKEKKGLLDFIPGLGFIPFFGGPAQDKTKVFAVDLKGKIYDMSSVKNFRWVAK